MKILWAAVKLRDVIAELVAYSGAALIIGGLAFGSFPLLVAGGLMFIPGAMFLSEGEK